MFVFLAGESPYLQVGEYVKKPTTMEQTNDKTNRNPNPNPSHIHRARHGRGSTAGGAHMQGNQPVQHLWQIILAH